MANFGGTFGKGFKKGKQPDFNDSFEADSRGSDFDRTNNDLAYMLNHPPSNNRKAGNNADNKNSRGPGTNPFQY